MSDALIECRTVALTVGSVTAFCRPVKPRIRGAASLRISNRHFLAGLEMSVTSRKYTVAANSNRHFWEGCAIFPGLRSLQS
jgi:hypothetical protein